MSGRIDYIRDGATIYARSFATIRAEARLARFSPAEERVAVRIIHACGMIEVADNVVFSPGAAEAASWRCAPARRSCATPTWSRMASRARACPRTMR